MIEIEQLFKKYPFVLFTIGVVMMGFAHYSELVWGLRPCSLCYWQRYIWYAIIAVCAMMMLANIGKYLQYLLGLLLLSSMILAIYHTGVEYQWWQGPSTCTGAIKATSAEDFAQILKNRPITRCDEVQWALFGLSMAGYNVLISFVLLLFGVKYYHATR